MFIMLEQEEGKKGERRKGEIFNDEISHMFNGAKRLKFRVCAEHIKNISRHRSTAFVRDSNSCSCECLVFPMLIEKQSELFSEPSYTR